MIASILACPLVAGYLMARNCSALELHDRKGKVWLWSIAAFLVIVAVSMILPPQVPAVFYIFLNAAIGWYLPQYLIGSELEHHVAEGGPVYSNWRSAGIAIAFIAILAAITFTAWYAMDTA